MTPQRTLQTKTKCNPELPIIKKGYEGTSFVRGRFKNEYKVSLKFSLGKAFLHSFKKRKAKKAVRTEFHTIPVLHMSSLPLRKKDSLVWLGHSSFLLTLNKKRILIDPQLSEHWYLRRKTIIPCKPELFTGIDYLCLSHNHRDHLDKQTIKKISVSKQAKILTPLGLSPIIKKWKNDVSVQEAAWFQQYNTSKDIKIFFLPAKHWSMRYPWNINKSLWGSFLIQTKNKTIFFCGDTAFTNHFQDIHKLFPKIDVCIMPIGAYEPATIMLPNHMDPKQSVEAFKMLQGETFIPMHYGTFVLSDDSSEISLALLQEEMTKQKKKKKLIIPAIGEVISL